MVQRLRQGFNLRYRVQQLLDLLRYPIWVIWPRSKINLGSGRRTWPGWFCFDEVEYPGVHRFAFRDDFILPVSPLSMETVYTSHFLEHVPDPVVDQVLRESWRCLKFGGTLVIKIPDFDYFVNAYLEGNFSAFEGIGVESVLSTWPSKGLQDDIHARFTMMFCGYMNQAYGRHFAGNSSVQGPTAFHGPPRVDGEELRNLILKSDRSPHAVAAHLRSKVDTTQDFLEFNHQNAWSKQELNRKVEDFGFKIVADSPKISQRLFREIPDFESMLSFSSVTVAQKQ